MRNIFVAGIITASIMLSAYACSNKDFIDTNLTYNKAIIELHDGTTITVDVKKWRDYSGVQLQITTKDGITYLTSTYNCTLIRE